MANTLTGDDKMKNFIDAHKQDLYKTLEELCAIPAPSHFEHKRAEYCKNWLGKAGAKGFSGRKTKGKQIAPVNGQILDGQTGFFR